MFKMITTVFIDIDDTLLDFHKCAKESMHKVFDDINIPFEDSMFAVFTEVNNNLWHKLEKGIIERKQIHSTRWNIIFEKLGINYDGNAFEEKFLLQLAHSAVPVTYAKELMEYLSSKYTICAASNAPYEQQLIRLKTAGLFQYIHKFFISEKIGFSKPDKRFFDACFEKLGSLSAVNTILIGDSPTADIQAANTYGIKSCWFNPHRKELPGGIHADYIVESLSEICSIL